MDAPLGHPQRQEPRRDGLVPRVQPQQAQRRGRPQGREGARADPRAGEGRRRRRRELPGGRDGPPRTRLRRLPRRQPRHHLRVVVGLRPDRPVPQATRAGPPDPGAQRPDVPDGPQGRSADRVRRRDQRPVHGDAHRGRRAGGPHAPCRHRRGPEDRGRPLLVHGRAAAAGADVLLRTRRAAPAPRREPRLGLVDRAVRHLRDEQWQHRDRDDAVPDPGRGARPVVPRAVRHARQDGRVARRDLRAPRGAPARRHERRTGSRSCSSTTSGARPSTTYEQLADDPQVAHNKLFWDVPVGDGEATFRTPGSPITFSRTPAGIQHGVPRAGQHTAELFPDQA